jgi:translation initiation factor IF-2
MSAVSTHTETPLVGRIGCTEGVLRVHELAKKLGLQNKELVEKLQAAGVPGIKTHSSSVDEAEAMKAIGKGPAAEKKKEAPSTMSRPRTMVRMRGGEGAEGDQRQPEAAAEEPIAAPVEERAVVVEAAPPERPTMVQESPMVVRAFREPPPPVVVEEPAIVEAPVATIAAAPAEAVAAASPDAVSADAVATGVAPPAAADAGGSNVVRVIDPNAIRARLQAEGRDFSPRPKRTFAKVREIKVVNDRFGGAPQMVDVTTAAGARPGGKKPVGSGKVGGEPDFKDRREQRGGARDMWLNPGKKRKSGKKGRGPEITQAAAHKRVVEMADAITVGDLAHQMAIKSGQVITKLMSMGMMVTVNQVIDYETAAIVATEFGFEVKNETYEEADMLGTEAEKEVSAHTARAPVVTVMGHVDHGKTSLLDFIRKSKVASGEAGGITQHIGAYSVETERGRITFLDTPGHAAFTAMRQRGAQVTDIVVLVVAADDGVMPQTIEAIKHAQEAEVPIVVALNKADRPDAKPERVMQELTEYKLVPEEWGGETIMLPVSAKTGLNMDKLLESILLQAEVLQLSADTDRRAQGIVIEAQLDKGRGPVATVLIQQGTLKNGDFIVAGPHSGKVRAMYASNGALLKEAGPSDPVQVLGLAGVPDAGDRFDSVADDRTAKEVAQHRTQKQREAERNKTAKVSLEDFLKKTPQSEAVQDLRIIVKADVGGSMEALSHALKNLSTTKVTVNILRSGVGTITENDVNDAIASNAIVIGFNAKPDSKAQALAQHEKVDVRTYSIIYEAIEEMQQAMAALLAPKLEERYVGKAEVRALFRVPKLGVIAGSYVLDGKIQRSGKVRVMRGKDKLFEGSLSSLKRFKDDVREVAAGYECGIGVAGFNDLIEGDVVECLEIIEVRADIGETLSAMKAPAPGGTNQAGAPA